MGALSPSLRRLFIQVDSIWPTRDRRTDGWYTDPRVRRSIGHNPGRGGLTHAIDVDADGIDKMWIINHIYRSRDVMYYIIWDRRVWSTSTGWDGHRYTGSNPHIDHMHIEIRQTVYAENWGGSWFAQSGIGVAPPSAGIGTAPAPPGQAGLGARDDRDPRAHMLSIANETAADGWVAYQTALAVANLRLY